MITPKNLVRHELISLPIEIIDSKNKKNIGISGRVIDETRNMLVIEKTNGKEAKLVKDQCVFVFVLPDKTKVKVDGKILVGRPEDRIKKKFRKW
jgi:ribonuclease P protein subunit POP4